MLNYNISNDKKYASNIDKITNILGDNFKYKFIFDKNVDKLKVYSFEFINKLSILNINKTKYIHEKILELKLAGFLDVEDLKIHGIGRYIIVKIKTIDDYEEEKKNIEKEYLNKIAEINCKIEILKNQEENIS